MALAIVSFLISAESSVATVVTSGPFYLRFGDGAADTDRKEIIEVVAALWRSLPRAQIHMCSTPSSYEKQRRRQIHKALVANGVEKRRIRDAWSCNEGLAKGKPRDAVAVIVGPG